MSQNQNEISIRFSSRNSSQNFSIESPPWLDKTRLIFFPKCPNLGGQTCQTRDDSDADRSVRGVGGDWGGRGGTRKKSVAVIALVGVGQLGMYLRYNPQFP